MVAAAAVGDNFHTRQRQCNVGRQRREQLLTGLRRQHGIVQLQGRIPKAAGALPSDLMDLWRQAMLLYFPRALPGLEVSGLSAGHHVFHMHQLEESM